MKKLYRQTKLSAVALILVIAVSASLAALPTAAAQGVTRQSYAFIGATPNPVGVNQEVLLHIGVTQQLSSHEEGWEGLSVTIERPDGETDVFSNIRTDATGGTSRNYVPDMVGAYYLQTHFPTQTATFTPFMFGDPYNVTLLASDSPVLELVVQEEQLTYYAGVPLPSEYWTRPINAQFHEWTSIAGDWLRPAGGYTMPPIPKYHSGNADAPETAHILWTKELALGGLVGGELGDVQYEMGDAYEGKFSGSVIIAGNLYYNRFEERGGDNVEQEVVAVDLHTGEELWVRNWDNARLAFGQTFFWDSYNYHGVFGYLWTTDDTTWDAYDAQTGRWVYRMTNVPSGWNLYGDKGEIYRYTVDLTNGWMTLWNSSRVVSDGGSWNPHGNTYDAGDGIEWNITIPADLPESLCMYFLHDRIFGTTAGGLTGSVAEKTITSWAISVKPDEEGTVIFNRSWIVPESDLTLVWTDASAEDGVFIISGKENRKYYGFSLDNGALLWETEPEHYLSIYDKWYGPAYGYGKFYTGRMTGIVTCYDIKTGKELWTYNVKDTFHEILWSNNFPIEFHFLADGKLYLSSGEHSPINPNGRGAPFVCLNATDGTEIWKLSWTNNWWGGHALIGDSIIAGMNAYDNRIYAIGKGASATTVEAPLVAVLEGKSITLRGTVTDESPGTDDYALAARFPNGVPAVADESMTDWMQYVYMQYERPDDAAGVTVTLEAIDSNGEHTTLGTASTNMDGEYGFTWTPETEGTYEIVATFEETKSYYGSHDTTFVSIEDVPPEGISTEVIIILAVVAVAVIIIVGYWLLRHLR